MSKLRKELRDVKSFCRNFFVFYFFEKLSDEKMMIIIILPDNKKKVIITITIKKTIIKSNLVKLN